VQRKLPEDKYGIEWDGVIWEVDRAENNGPLLQNTKVQGDTGLSPKPYH
jgi:hypothetical protein